MRCDHAMHLLVVHTVRLLSAWSSTVLYYRSTKTAPVFTPIGFHAITLCLTLIDIRSNVEDHQLKTTKHTLYIHKFGNRYVNCSHMMQMSCLVYEIRHIISFLDSLPPVACNSLHSIILSIRPLYLDIQPPSLHFFFKHASSSSLLVYHSHLPSVLHFSFQAHDLHVPQILPIV